MNDGSRWVAVLRSGRFGYQVGSKFCVGVGAGASATLNAWVGANIVTVQGIIVNIQRRHGRTVVCRLVFAAGDDELPARPPNAPRKTRQRSPQGDS